MGYSRVRTLPIREFSGIELWIWQPCRRSCWAHRCQNAATAQEHRLPPLSEPGQDLPHPAIPRPLPDVRSGRDHHPHPGRLTAPKLEQGVEGSSGWIIEPPPPGPYGNQPGPSSAITYQPAPGLCQRAAILARLPLALLITGTFLAGAFLDCLQCPCFLPVISYPNTASPRITPVLRPIIASPSYDGLYCLPSLSDPFLPSIALVRASPRPTHRLLIV